MEHDRQPKRKWPAHGVHVPSLGPAIVYVTCCANNREPWMANPAVHKAMHEVWSSANAWLVGRYVIMPDHVHLFAAKGDSEVELEAWTRYWKRLVTQTLGAGPGKWQDSQWDTRMRSPESYREKLDYVLMNPVRKGLVQQPEEWPYSGEVHALDW